MISLTVITAIKNTSSQNNKTKYNFIFHKNSQHHFLEKMKKILPFKIDTY
ncbi:hypothetical protein Q7O_002603 [Pectobacterium carotovorum subsp. carotovorum PCCS1]|nr:hypothetical protein [Pectobacterium carotovorum subsp. carotovorum PCCS1]